MTDQEIVEKLVSNDPGVIRHFFFVRCRSALAYVGQYFCGNRYGAEELIGEFYEFLSADDWHKLRIFRYSCSLNAYVTVIASRYFQKKRDKAMLSLDVDRDGESGLTVSDVPVVMPEDRSLLKIVEVMLSRMQPLDRILLSRILLDGEKPGDIIDEVFPYIDIENIGKKSREQLAGYVYTRYARAKAKLRNALKALGYGD